MTNHHDTSESRPRGVLDPAWEDELRRGQAEEGETGSVEPELETLALLRHLREPDTLAPQQLDDLWRSIAAEVAPKVVPWWRKAWVWWSAPALAAAAVLAVIVIQDPKQEAAAVAREDARAERKQAERRAEAEPAVMPTAAPEAIAGEGAARSGAAAPTAADDTFAMRESDKGELDQFEASFQQLAPYGRRAIRGSLDESYDDLRSNLLADAKGATP